VVSGTLLGYDLDGLVQASGVEVTNNGSRPFEHSGVADEQGNEDYANSLNVTALSAINTDLGQGMLQLPLNNGTGVLGQYAQARSNGIARGASGFVEDNGAIATEPGGGYPDLAALDLSSLIGALDPDLALTLGDVANVKLRVGAVAGRATLDGCKEAWGVSLAQSLTREYLTSHVRTEFSSQTVGALVAAISGRISALQGAVNTLSTNNGVLTQVQNGTTSLLNGVLDLGGIGALLGVSLGSVTVNSLSATIDTSAVTSTLMTPFGDSAGVLTIDPATGAISIDTSALLASAYGGQYGDGLNNQPPNTKLLDDPKMVDSLQDALTEALADWIENVNIALTQAIDAVALNLKLTVIVRAKLFGIPLPLDIAKIEATTVGTLASLTTTTSTEILRSGLLTSVLNLVGNLAASLVTGLGGVVRDAVNGVLNAFRSLPSAVTALTGPVVIAVTTLYNRLYIDGIVTLTVNAQNDPSSGPPAPGAVPLDWQNLASGRYDVAALRVSVLEALPDGARVYLGRASVGRSCSPVELPLHCPTY